MAAVFSQNELELDYPTKGPQSKDCTSGRKILKLSNISTVSGESEIDSPSPKVPPKRYHLPDERKSLTHKFVIHSHDYGPIKGYLNVGFYHDGTPGEVFIHIAKEGTLIQGLCDALCISISMALQYGVPLDKFVNKLKGQRFETEGFTETASIPIATSIVDYIFRYLGQNYCGLEPHPSFISKSD